MRYILLASLMIASLLASAQSKTTEALHKKNSDAMSLFFYNNTLRMINMSEDKDFDALIKDIEKMKVLMIDNSKLKVDDYKKLVGSYKQESFEEIMSSRFEGKNFDVFLKEEDNKTKGMVVTVNTGENLFVLDIVGSVALDKITKFFSKLEESSDIGQKIKAFTDKK